MIQYLRTKTAKEKEIMDDIQKVEKLLKKNNGVIETYQVEELGILDNNELKYGKKMLVSAALTYVAGAATAMLQILRLILIFGGRRDD